MFNRAKELQQIAKRNAIFMSRISHFGHWRFFQSGKKKTQKNKDLLLKISVLAKCLLCTFIYAILRFHKILAVILVCFASLLIVVEVAIIMGRSITINFSILSHST